MNGEWLRLGRGGIVPVHWAAKGPAADTGALEGWASVYNVVDEQDDIVVPGAFAKTLQLWRSGGRVIVLTNGHDNSPEGVIGSVTKANDTAYGLKLGFKYSAAPDAQAIRLKAAEGLINGLSIFGPVIRKSYETRDGRELRILQEVGLWAVGLTPMPANQKSLVTSAKDAAGEDEQEQPGGLSEVWICDMKSALSITVPGARKAAVDLLVRQQYTLADPDPEPPQTEPADGDGETAKSSEDASSYALDLIAESGPGATPPSGEPEDSLADLLATTEVAKTSAELDALAAQLGAQTGR